ncbi:Uncharacterised protein [Mycobacteroides abscessus subsp. abscessus]|nr:Uncharacterised protein [Mycobacteroides abscessus subsp. abscessus]
MRAMAVRALRAAASSATRNPDQVSPSLSWAT